MAFRTMADIHWGEAQLAVKKEILLEQLRLRFKSVSDEMKQAIDATNSTKQLTSWLRRFATAEDLDSIGILSPR